MSFITLNINYLAWNGIRHSMEIIQPRGTSCLYEKKPFIVVVVVIVVNVHIVDMSYLSNSEKCHLIGSQVQKQFRSRLRQIVLCFATQIMNPLSSPFNFSRDIGKSHFVVFV